MSFLQHNCREVRRIAAGKNIIENARTLFGNFSALLLSVCNNNPEMCLKQIDIMRQYFVAKKMKKVSIILKQLHLRKGHCSFNDLDDLNKQFVARILKSSGWTFYIRNIVGDMPRELFFDDDDYHQYGTMFEILHS